MTATDRFEDPNITLCSSGRGQRSSLEIIIELDRSEPDLL